MRLLSLTISLIGVSAVAGAATKEEPQRFLRQYRHSWCPYALPRETSLAEIEKVARLGFDTVGMSFVAPYNSGDIDFSRLDEAVRMIAERGQQVVLFLAPRFLDSEGVADQLDNGKIIQHVWDKNPNYSMIDIFDPVQRRKFVDWLKRCAVRYGKDDRVAAFVLGWGYQGETGFYNGDWNTKFEWMGSECAGYSPHALAEFNKWRTKKTLPEVAALPLPSLTEQSDDYVLFHRFRSEFIRNVFHREMIGAVKQHTQLAVGIYAYIAASTDSYARDWTDAPNADFYRSAGSTASFDMTRTLIDSGIGWEDSLLHDGKWNFTAACMERDQARQIAKGGVFHAMYVRVYETEPQWENGVFDKVVVFLKTQELDKGIRRTKATVALFQPTWGAAALPGRSEAQKFLPKVEYWHYLDKMIGLAESFGLPYDLVTEWDLLDAARLKRFQHIIVPMWELIPKVVGKVRYRKLANDKRVVRIPLKEWALTRSEFRDVLKQAGIKTRLDFDSDKILAGRTHNLVYNWDEKPIQVRVPEREDDITLQPYQYLFVDPKAETAE